MTVPAKGATLANTNLSQALRVVVTVQRVLNPQKTVLHALKAAPELKIGDCEQHFYNTVLAFNTR